MSSPINTSQKRKSENLKKQMQAGLWPPVGNPWGAVVLLPEAELEQVFQSAVWKALLQALHQIQEAAVAKALSPNGDRDEARGEYNIASDLIELPDVVRRCKSLMKE